MEAEVDRNIRDGIIDYLELASSFSEQLAYQRRAPGVHVSNEVINQWEDWVRRPPVWSEFPAELYSAEEIAALQDFHREWTLAADETPGRLPSIEEVQRLDAWHRLRRAAEAQSAAEFRFAFVGDFG